MPTNYSNTLIDNSEKADGVINEDMNYKDTRNFHELICLVKYLN